MPPTDDYGQGIEYLAPYDPPDLAGATQEIVDGFVPRSVMRFQSASERNATITSPVPGMIAYLVTEDLFTGYTASGWMVLAAGSQAWTTLDLAAGYAHNGNNNGTAQYRLVNLFGELTIMFRGGVSITYEGGLAPNSGRFLATLLPSGARPTTLRTASAPCSVVTSDIASVKLDGEIDGDLRFVIDAGSTPPWVALNGVFYSL